MVVLQVRRHSFLVMCVRGSQIAMQSAIRCAAVCSRLMLPVDTAGVSEVSAALAASTEDAGSANATALIEIAPARIIVRVLANLGMKMVRGLMSGSTGRSPCSLML